MSLQVSQRVAAECKLRLGSVFSAFFRQGQVLETFRGNGIFQPAVDAAIQRLNEGHWVSVRYPDFCVPINTA